MTDEEKTAPLPGEEHAGAVRWAGPTDRKRPRALGLPEEEILPAGTAPVNEGTVPVPETAPEEEASGAGGSMGEAHSEETPPAPVDPAEEIQRHADETEQVYFDRIMPFAEKGDVHAQVKVAEALFYGRGTATNRAAAVEWYRKAAVAGDGSAQASLGYCLLNGLGCEARKDEAAVWYAKGAAQDDPNAINGLAFCYLHGFGVEKDEKRGFELAMKAAVRGHAPSQTLVGECFLEGRGVARDQERGEAWLYRATRQNNKRAENLLQVY